MGWPQITMIVLMCIHIVGHALGNGKPIDNVYNMNHALVRVCILAIILYFGGFFTNPQ